MRDLRQAEAAAARRVELLSPLLAEGLDPARARQLRAQICAQSGLSERTLRRYLARYHLGGFAALKPGRRGKSGHDPVIPDQIIEQAIVLRREVPSRSVAQLIQILEWEGLIKPGQVKRSTLQEKLAERGYSTRQMRLYTTGGIAARRYQQPHRNRLWHSDIKFGPYLGAGKDKQQVYLVTFIDDATRFVLHGEFYPTLDQVIIEDCFRQAIHKYGVPQAVYFDNGKQYRTKWMARACAKMGIRLLYARPYSPEATGKIERFNRVVDSFLSEAALEKPTRREKLNELFWVWLEECYQNKPHSALKDNQSPTTAYQGDSQPLRYLDAETIKDAFLHSEARKVDKAGCISFKGKKYEVGVTFAGCTVDCIYDPSDLSELTCEYAGHTPWEVKELAIGAYAGKRPKLPEHLAPQAAKSSRLLTGAARQNEARRSRQTPAVSYRAVRKADDEHV